MTRFFRFFTCITAFFMLVNDLSAQSLIYGLLENSNNHKIVVYFDCGTSTTHTVLDLYPIHGNIYTNLFGGSSDVFNKRYFFSGSPSISSSSRFFTVNLNDLNVTTSTSLNNTSNDLLDMEYDPFYNRILYHSLNELLSYDIANDVVNTISTIPDIYGIIYGSNRAFDPISQQYYYMYSDGSNNQKGMLIDVTTGDVVSTLAETGGNSMMAFDFTTLQYYRLDQNKVVSFDPVSGQSTDIATIPYLTGLLNNQMAVIDYTAHTYILPYISNTLNNKLATVDLTGQSAVSAVAFNSADLTKLYYDGCKPLIRKNNEYQLMCTFGTGYQWYKNGVPITGAISQTLDIYDSGDYYAQVESMTGDFAATETISYLFTGISKVKGNRQFSMSPNPFADQTTLHLNGISQTAEIRISDLSGRRIRTIKTQGENTIVLKREDLLPGIYMVTVLNNGRVLQTQKLVVASE